MHGDKFEILQGLYNIVNERRENLTVGKILLILTSLTTFEKALDGHIMELYEILKEEE